jgi:hypothetical protein
MKTATLCMSPSAPGDTSELDELAVPVAHHRENPRIPLAGHGFAWCRSPRCQGGCHRASARGSRKSPKVRVSTPSTVRRCDRPHRLPSFAAIARVAGVLAADSIRDDLQAHLALARVGEQPPSSTRPTSLPVRTRTKRLDEGCETPVCLRQLGSPCPDEPGRGRVTAVSIGTRWRAARLIRVKP